MFQWTVKKTGAVVATGVFTLAAIAHSEAGLFGGFFERHRCDLKKDKCEKTERRMPGGSDCSFGFFSTSWRPWDTCCADAGHAPLRGSEYSRPVPIGVPHDSRPFQDGAFSNSPSHDPQVPEIPDDGRFSNDGTGYSDGPFPGDGRYSNDGPSDDGSSGSYDGGSAGPYLDQPNLPHSSFGPAGSVEQDGSQYRPGVTNEPSIPVPQGVPPQMTIPYSSGNSGIPMFGPGPGNQSPMYPAPAIQTPMIQRPVNPVPGGSESVAPPQPGNDTPVGNDMSRYQPPQSLRGPLSNGRAGAGNNPAYSSAQPPPGFVPGQIPGGFVYQDPARAVPSGIPLPNPVAVPSASRAFAPPLVPGSDLDSDSRSGNPGRSLPLPAIPTPSGIPPEARYLTPGSAQTLQPTTFWQQPVPAGQFAGTAQNGFSASQNSSRPPQMPSYQQFATGQIDGSQFGIPNERAGIGASSGIRTGSGFQEIPAAPASSGNDSQWRLMRGANGPQQATNPSDRVVFIPGPGRQ